MLRLLTTSVLCSWRRLGNSLDQAMDVLLRQLFDVFENLHLEINCKPGKTEALLKYRGYQAVQLREARRCADGKLRLQVPGRPGIAIDVVQSYVHLGTHANVDGSCFQNATHRCSSAMAAYAPLSSKIFGRLRA
ncbi:unnamed protein product [Prorocentrum cordatum]|uniref:Uncharacterized protein n=1 Tax=Prorocentrum cordatum TaxID=2364126 RepID=A0ABN9QZW2_9DINO|nr:unnamed protein product [Polarella glacialis]